MSNLYIVISMHIYESFDDLHIYDLARHTKDKAVPLSFDRFFDLSRRVTANIHLPPFLRDTVAQVPGLAGEAASRLRQAVNSLVTAFLGA